MRTITSHALAIFMAFTLILLAFGLMSCSQDQEGLSAGATKSSLPFPTTPDQLMGNVYEAYGKQDLAAYDAALHPEFTFVQVDGESYGRDTELAITARMFSHEDHHKPDRTISGIARIIVDRFEGIGAWRTLSATDDHILRRTYDLKIRFVQNNGNILTIQGQADIQVIQDDIDLGGDETRLGYRILRWVDLTG